MPLTTVTTRMDVDAGGVEVLDGAALHVEEVADLAVRVGRVVDAVELEVGHAEAAFFASMASWRSCANMTPLVAHCTAKKPLVRAYSMARRKCGESVGSPRELDAHLAARLHGERVVEDLLDLFPLELVDVADLVRVMKHGRTSCCSGS